MTTATRAKTAALSFVLGAVWNTILLVQVFLYWNKTNEVLAAIKDAKTK